MSLRSVVLALLLGLSLGACAAAEAQSAGACADVAWGGYGGDARCAALAARVIPGADRACARDADCTLVHAGASCREQAVSASVAARYEAMEASCTHPAAGPCSPARPHCSSGCCVTDR